MKRPKRRKKNDNPYTLEYIDDKDSFRVLFKDGMGILRMVDVSEVVFNVMDGFELDDICEMNEFDRHIEHSELTENNLEARALNKSIGLEDYVIQKSTFEDLKKAIDLLPEIQKRRIKKYYFEDMTQKQIADEENVDIRSIQYTLNIALKKLKEILK